jgi:peptidyl-prolyl cis-trans isomerase D
MAITNPRTRARSVAKVDGNDITQSDWDRAHQREMDQLRNSMPNLDPKLLDSPEARYASLERLVRERVVAAAAEKFKLTTSDERLARELQQSPEIASLRRPTAASTWSAIASCWAPRA